MGKAGAFGWMMFCSGILAGLSVNHPGVIIGAIGIGLVAICYYRRFIMATDD